MTRTARLAFGLGILALFAAVPVAAEPLAAEPHPGESLAGTWKLDRAASDPIRPLLELLDAPWIARRMADTMSPTMQVSPAPNGGLRVVTANPLRTTDVVYPADGTDNTREDPLGRSVVTRERWLAPGRLVITQENQGEDGGVQVETTWERVEERLELRIVAQGPDGPVRILRVFRLEP